DALDLGSSGLRRGGSSPPFRISSLLKDHFQAQLDYAGASTSQDRILAGLVGRVASTTEGRWRTKISGRIRHNRVIQEIEEFRPELSRNPFFDHRVLEHRKVPIVERIASEHIPAGGSKCAGLRRD